MRYFIYGFFVLCGAAALLSLSFGVRAQGCEPIVFPVPEDIANLQMIDSRHGELTEIERATLEAYNQDSERYRELYDQAFPCPLVAGDGEKRLRAANSEPFIAELDALRAKWDRAETLPAGAQNEDEDTFIDIPQGEMVIIE